MYQEPKIIIVRLSYYDVICMSGEYSDDNVDDDGWT